MCWYMWEPRSKGYEEEADPGASSGLGLSTILLLPVALVVLFWVSFSPFLALFLYYLADVYKTTQKTLQTGEIAYPFLAKLGIVVMGYLLWVEDLAFFPGGLIASVLIFNHTFLPYAAVLIYKLRGFFRARAAG